MCDVRSLRNLRSGPVNEHGVRMKKARNLWNFNWNSLWYGKWIYCSKKMVDNTRINRDDRGRYTSALVPSPVEAEHAMLVTSLPMAPDRSGTVEIFNWIVFELRFVPLPVTLEMHRIVCVCTLYDVRIARGQRRWEQKKRSNEQRTLTFFFILSMYVFLCWTAVSPNGCALMIALGRITRIRKIAFKLYSATTDTCDVMRVTADDGVWRTAIDKLLYIRATKCTLAHLEIMKAHVLSKMCTTSQSKSGELSLLTSR